MGLTSPSPEYASFGKISGLAPAAAESSPLEAASPQAVGGSDEFKPTRRVRTVPGGASSDIFSHLDDGSAVDEPAPKPNRSPEPAPEPQDEGLHGFSSDFKPSRYVVHRPNDAQLNLSLVDVFDRILAGTAA